MNIPAIFALVIIILLAAAGCAKHLASSQYGPASKEYCDFHFKDAFCDRRRITTGSLPSKEVSPLKLDQKPPSIVHDGHAEPVVPVGLILCIVLAGVVTTSAIRRVLLGEVGEEALELALQSTKEKLEAAKEEGNPVLVLRCQLSAAFEIAYVLCEGFWDRISNLVDPTPSANKKIDD